MLTTKIESPDKCYMKTGFKMFQGDTIDLCVHVLARNISEL